MDYLGGEPGVYSARYSGEDATDASNNRLLLSKLAGVAPEKRGARFVCVLAFSWSGNESAFFVGETAGRIIESETGDKGFGYDPLFLSTELGVTFAQRESAQKNAISHRGRALAKFSRWLREL